MKCLGRWKAQNGMSVSPPTTLCSKIDWDSTNTTGNTSSLMKVIRWKMPRVNSLEFWGSNITATIACCWQAPLFRTIWVNYGLCWTFCCLKYSTAAMTFRSGFRLLLVKKLEKRSLWVWMKKNNCWSSTVCIKCWGLSCWGESRKKSSLSCQTRKSMSSRSNCQLGKSWFMTTFPQRLQWSLTKTLGKFPPPHWQISWCSWENVAITLTCSSETTMTSATMIGSSGPQENSSSSTGSCPN